jgi:uncharacterized protein (UPF0276 family)
MRQLTLPRGIGLAWRPETALLVDRRADLVFTEIVAENFSPTCVPRAVMQLVERGMPVVPHGISLSLGSTEPPEPTRLRRLGALAEVLRAPFVSEHVAFVRAGGVEIGHLTAVPHTGAMLDVLVDNVRRAEDALPVPLVLEHVASLVRWPEDELREEDFLAALLERTGARLLLDVANLHANAENHRIDPVAWLARIPMARVAYVHVAGGTWSGGLFHDTHAHDTTRGALALLAEAVRLGLRAPVLLERDDHFPPRGVLERELDAIAAVVAGARPLVEGASDVA